MSNFLFDMADAALAPRERYGRPPAEFKLMRCRELPTGEHMLTDPKHASDFWYQSVPGASWFDPEKECLVAITLNARYRATGFYLISIGTMDTVLVGISETFRPAIVLASKAIILVHNHPSGCITPSEADIKVTVRLRNAGAALDVEVADHLIVTYPPQAGTKHWFSLREAGYMGA